MMSLLMFLLFRVYCKIKTVDFVPKTINMIYAILLNVVRSPVFKNKTKLSTLLDTPPLI